MSATVGARVQEHCARCGGPMYSGYFDKHEVEFTCLLCGDYVLRAVPRPFVGKHKSQPTKPVARGEG